MDDSTLNLKVLLKLAAIGREVYFFSFFASAFQALKWFVLHYGVSQRKPNGYTA
ncbi:hypothetical protein BDW66DRAFT_112408 [Aspergillus desertorum]